ncbi:sensor histidine kinase [Halarcobacter ebronensis]|uniref:sensor histidine kinase n=1 Tax=Halarcobacter ebronensis TaxID=1462615 RepID=UPI001009EC27|nr:ATP-binding protein [Halarcobacter ebronensis]
MLRLKYFIFFIVLSFITYLALNFIVKDSKDKFLEQTTLNYEKAYNSVLSQYKELSEVIFTGLLRFTRIDEKLLDIQSKNIEEKNSIRKELYLQTISRFNSLEKKHIISINYILPDNTIFLKMVDPLDYGMELSSKRETINFVLKNKIPTYSYEIGKYGSGYRFAYPIIKNDTFLGIISLTFSERAITSSLMNQYEVFSNFIIYNKDFDKEFLNYTNTYQRAHFDNFLHRKEVLEDLKEYSQKNINQIKPSEDISKVLYEKGERKEASSIFIDEKDSIVTIIPIHHLLTKEYLGFISLISKGSTINLINSNHYTILALLIILYFSLTLLFLQQRIKILKDKSLNEEMLKKDQQLLEQAKMAQMGEMIGNIAHQWRQPLSAISTVASGVKLNYEYGILNQDDISKNMDIIVENTKYLSKTIDTFRDFIKEKRVEKEVFIQEKIEESLKIVQSSLENNHIKLIKEIDYNNPVLIHMISEELSQVIINIINNAKDAIIINQIKEGWIKISQYSNEKECYIYIEDNAGGIEESLISKIFDPYFTTKHQSQGTGLGLYMSKIIIEKHLHGKIVVSNIKDGALFKIIIPLKK